MTADLALLAASPETALDQAADPAAFVMLACERAKTWLTQALDHGSIEQIVELKSQAEAIRVYTAQKQIGKDAELAAAEIVRRAERGIGLAIRKGQEAGEIAAQGDVGGTGAPGVHGGNPGVGRNQHLARPTELAQVSEKSQLTPMYALADAGDDQFERALHDAKSEGNLSRANVVRKVKGEPAKPSTERPDVLRRARHVKPERVLAETVYGVEGFCIALAGLEPSDFDSLDLGDVEGWLSSLEKSIRSLNRVKKELSRVRA